MTSFTNCFSTINRKAILTILSFFIIPSFIFSQQVDSKNFNDLKFRHVGPVGNRVVAVQGIPGDPLTYYVGAASGGIWKTEDGGLNWKPIFDDKPVHAIGALAIAPSDNQVIWAGTGEPFIRSNVSIGDGVWKSTDGGTSWKNMGLGKTGRISRIIVHPTNPDIVYVAALGHCYLPQEERGIYRTKDGGESWERVHHVDQNTGASDLVMAPNNPRILFAGMWQIDIKTWGRESGGPGSGIFMSNDGGDTWKRLEGNGLPKLPVGKIALAMTPADPKRIYALIETGDGVPWHGQKTDSGELWRSDNGGMTWQLVNYNRDLAGRQAYYTRCAVSPRDEDELYFLSAGYLVSKDGGKTAQAAGFLNSPNWDHHDMWIDPTDSDRLAVAGDGGISFSHNRGKSWFRVQLPVAQLYHVTVDNKIPYNVLTNRQDGPSAIGPSRSRVGGWFGGAITRAMWHEVGGGESGFATPDPVDPDIIWSSTSGYGPRTGIVVRYNEKNRQFRHVEVWPESNGGWPAEELKYRFQWTFPLHVSIHDHNTVYVTSQHVHRTNNGGQSWEVISPDLTLNDKSKQKISGGLTPDNINVEYYCVIYAFDESPVQQGLFWVGTNDGLIQISRDNGASWKNVTENIPDLPPWGTVRNIDASKWEAGKAYITVDFHQVGNFAPYVYKTEDFGETWTKITNRIPESTLSYCRNIREDPVRQGLLYLGTENALYISFDDGANWQPFMNNLPAAPMYWLQVQEHFNDLVLGTYGRGIWILDDVTPLQQFTTDVAASGAHLFKPRHEYRFRPITDNMYLLGDPTVGQDPPYGAAINYWQGAENKDSVVIEISNSAGELVKTFKRPGKPGMNRIWWNLQDEPSKQITMRTPPLHADWVPLDKNRTRNAHQGPISIVVPPGTYTVKMKTGGQEFAQTLDILKDPHSEGSEEDIAKQTALMKELKKDLEAAGSVVHKIEAIRQQIGDMKLLLKDKKDLKEVLAAADSLNQKLIDLESKLIQLKITGTGQDPVRWPSMLIERIGYLASTIAVADFPPTDQHYEVHKILRGRLEMYQREMKGIVINDIPAFEEILKKHNLGLVIVNMD